MFFSQHFRASVNRILLASGLLFFSYKSWWKGKCWLTLNEFWMIPEAPKTDIKKTLNLLIEVHRQRPDVCPQHPNIGYFWHVLGLKVLHWKLIRSHYCILLMPKKHQFFFIFILYFKISYVGHIKNILLKVEDSGTSKSNPSESSPTAITTTCFYCCKNIKHLNNCDLTMFTHHKPEHNRCYKRCQRWYLRIFF